MNGVLHATTAGVGGQTMNDVFATGKEKAISMSGYAVKVIYTWEGETLVANVTSADGKLAGGTPITMRRWVEDGQLHAQSTCGDVVWLRRYERID